MVFLNGVGPGGRSVVVGRYHWPKGVQGMDRHMGRSPLERQSRGRRVHRGEHAGILDG
jgi:hypothetical protein